LHCFRKASFGFADVLAFKVMLNGAQQQSLRMLQVAHIELRSFTEADLHHSSQNGVSNSDALSGIEAIHAFTFVTF